MDIKRLHTTRNDFPGLPRYSLVLAKPIPSFRSPTSFDTPRRPPDVAGRQSPISDPKRAQVSPPTQSATVDSVRTHAIGLLRNPDDLDLPRRQVDHEEHVVPHQLEQPHHFDGEEVCRGDLTHMRPQERPPRRARSALRREVSTEDPFIDYWPGPGRLPLWPAEDQSSGGAGGARRVSPPPPTELEVLLVIRTIWPSSVGASFCRSSTWLISAAGSTSKVNPTERSTI